VAPIPPRPTPDPWADPLDAPPPPGREVPSDSALPVELHAAVETSRPEAADPAEPPPERAGPAPAATDLPALPSIPDLTEDEEDAPTVRATALTPEAWARALGSDGPQGRSEDIATEEIPAGELVPPPSPRMSPAPVFLSAQEMGITQRSRRKGAPPKRRANTQAPPGTPTLELDPPPRNNSAILLATVWALALAVAVGLAIAAIAGIGAASWLTGGNAPTVVEAPVAPAQETPQVPVRVEPADAEAPAAPEPSPAQAREQPPSPRSRPTPTNPDEPTETVGTDSPWDVPSDTPVLEAEPEAVPEAAPVRPERRSKRQR
jgi:hypothetical protein